MNSSGHVEFKGILGEHLTGIEKLFLEFEKEKDVQTKNHKAVEESLAAKIKETEESLTAKIKETEEKVKFLTKEKQSLLKMLDFKDNELNQFKSKTIYLEGIVRSNQKKYLDKAKSWKKFMNAIEMKCRCGLAKKLRSSGFESSVRNEVVETSPKQLEETSLLKEKSDFKGKYKSHNLFDTSPTEIQNKVEQLAPMTELYSNRLSQNLSSTPVVGETEFIPVVDLNSEDEIEDSPKSPSIFDTVGEKESPVRNEKDVEFKKPLYNLETPKRKHSNTYDTSGELFSDGSPAINKNLSLKPTLKQIKLNASSWISKPTSYDVKVKEDLTVDNPMLKKVRKYISEDSFFNEYETDNEVNLTMEKKIERKEQNNDIDGMVHGKALEENLKCQKEEEESSVPKNVDNCREQNSTSLDDLENSPFFDKLLKKNERNPDYKFNEVVRKKADREKLKGFDCEECRRYYASDNLTENQLKDILKRCSRHRHQSTPPPSTPDEFWKIGFPDTQECKNRGYLLDDDHELPDHIKPKWGKGNKKRIKYQ